MTRSALVECGARGSRVQDRIAIVHQSGRRPVGEPHSVDDELAEVRMRALEAEAARAGDLLLPKVQRPRVREVDRVLLIAARADDRKWLPGRVRDDDALDQ